MAHSNAPSLTSEIQELVSTLKYALPRLETMPELLKDIKTSLADLQQRVEALEQQQPGKSPKRKR
jgi:uncharacterized membrane protein